MRWQRDPYGSGAHLTGGRWNAVGTNALYLSLDHATAITEFHQSLVRPGVLAAFDVVSPAIVDLTDTGVLATRQIVPSARFCDWRALYLLENAIPPSWSIAVHLIAEGAHGALVPSAQNEGGTNLVLWRWNRKGIDGAKITLVDPDQELDRA